MTDKTSEHGYRQRRFVVTWERVLALITYHCLGRHMDLGNGRQQHLNFHNLLQVKCFMPPRTMASPICTKNRNFPESTGQILMCGILVKQRWQETAEDTFD
jgi:hypothetical protein